LEFTSAPVSFTILFMKKGIFRRPRAFVFCGLGSALLLAAGIHFVGAARRPFAAPPPVQGIGYPSRAPGVDVRPGFRNPPPGYGEVGFYWWLGDPLTKERLLWQLNRLQGAAISGLQINYAHSDQGGRSYGLTFPSDPPLFSEAWWDLFGWFRKECRKRGWAVSLSDYTLATPGQGWWTDDIIRENPGRTGSVLEFAGRDVAGPAEVVWDLPVPPISIAAYRLQDGAPLEGSEVDLRGSAAAGKLRWAAPAGDWRLAAVSARREPMSVDPMSAGAGERHVEKFFQVFEDRFPGEGGRGLNFFFSDELTFGVKGNLWNDAFAAEFRRRKGYDLVPELPSLFLDTGRRAPKVRLDYRDVLVSLSEENYFRPIYEWHARRGMLYGCDHGWRGRDVLEFGDYFRTQRWTTGPGNDQPRLEVDGVKNKVASSIAHLYERPRTWLEGYYSSGWGTSTADLVEATFRNFVMGHNLLTLHGLYYSTHGGFWEWAPPDNHFRMPYWAHLDEFLRCAERLSYLLSQGVHRCDVAVLYPVAAMEAGLNGNEAPETAFAVGPALFDRGIDYDFMDFESLARARVEDRELRVAGEAYRVLVLPAMAAVRFSTLEKALEFYRSGGLVVSLGALPEASERAGRDDPMLAAMVREIFGAAPGETGVPKEARVQRNAAGGRGVWASRPEHVVAEIRRAIPPDFELSTEADATRPAQVLHRRIGPRDVYLVLGAPKGSWCSFRAKGRVELWNPWTGEVGPLPVHSVSETGTRVRMPLESKEAQLIVFGPEEPGPAVEETNLDEVTLVAETDRGLRVEGWARTPGEKTAEVRQGGTKVRVNGAADDPGPVIRLDGLWEFELRPTLDNRWGDFRLPAGPETIGAEARRFRFREESLSEPGWEAAELDDAEWERTTASFGPGFWRLGPLSERDVPADFEARLANLGRIDPSRGETVGGAAVPWRLYDFSLRWGREDDPGHQGYHGLKENVGDDFICLGAPRWARTEYAYDPEPGGTRYYLWTAVHSTKEREVRPLMGGNLPAAVYIDGVRLKEAARPVRLTPGVHRILLRYDRPGRGHFVLSSGDDARDPVRYPLAMRWYRDPQVLLFDVMAGAKPAAGWYRFLSPPGFRSMKFPAYGRVRAWADGREMTVVPGKPRDDGAREHEATARETNELPVVVALRIDPEAGYYAGAAIPEPIRLECAAGRMSLGDWAKAGSLEHYSGGAWYRKNFVLAPDEVESRVLLDLGEVVSSAEVHVNGRAAGVRVAPPWRLDIGGLVRAGENRLEILVYNTLGNHYGTIPTRYRGSTRSGLLGPVTVQATKRVVLH
jgi:hypothetical protein